jgi:type IV pilus assembly protein PilF
MWLLTRIMALIIISTLCACVSQTKDPYNNNTLATKQAIAHTNLGAAYFQEQKLEIALEEFKIAIDYDPNYAQAYNGLGLVEATLGQTKKANDAFSRSIQLDPTNSQSQNNYGNFLCGNGHHLESIPHFLEAVKNPLYSTPNLAYTNAGICAMRGGDSNNAEKYFIDALKIQPLTHVAAYHLASIQFKRGEATKAQATLQNSLMVSPNPESLWLGIQIARKLGARNDEASYTILLRKQFPNSPQAQQLTPEQD